VVGLSILAANGLTSRRSIKSSYLVHQSRPQGSVRPSVTAVQCTDRVRVCEEVRERPLAADCSGVAHGVRTQCVADLLCRRHHRYHQCTDDITSSSCMLVAAVKYCPSMKFAMLFDYWSPYCVLCSPACQPCSHKCVSHHIVARILHALASRMFHTLRRWTDQ